MNTFSKAVYLQKMQIYLNEKKLLAKNNPQKAKKDSIKTLTKMGLISEKKVNK